MLLRDLVAGRRAEWLDKMVFLVAPIFNADGNEKIALNNRGPQHGPMGGQGTRANAQGLNINRDQHEARFPRSPGVRPDDERLRSAGADGPTTNGTRHAHHLTYSPPQPGDRQHLIIDLLRNPVVPMADGDGSEETRVGLLLLRQPWRRPRQPGARLAVLRSPPAVQQQLHRPAQPVRAPQRGLCLRDVQGSDHRHQPVRRREPEPSRATPQGSATSRETPIAGKSSGNRWPFAPKWPRAPTPSRSCSEKSRRRSTRKTAT